MQYLKHSTTDDTITALSDGLTAARSLERLKQKYRQFNAETLICLKLASCLHRFKLAIFLLQLSNWANEQAQLHCIICKYVVIKSRLHIILYDRYQIDAKSIKINN